MVKFFEGGTWTSAAGIVPALPGVYALLYDRQVVYIGMSNNLLRRYGEWSVGMQTRGRGVGSQYMLRAIHELDRSGWAFHVLKADASMTREQLSKDERYAIRRALDKGARLLNFNTPNEVFVPRAERDSYINSRRDRFEQSITKVTDSEP